VIAAINVAVHVTAWSAPITVVISRFEAPLAQTAAEISARLGYRQEG
jgi:IclR family pca regulon transcriptional regulator